MIANMEVIDMDAHEHAELTAAIKSNKKCQSTKTQYKRKQIHFEEWVQIKRPGLNRQGAWLCNVDKNIHSYIRKRILFHVFVYNEY